ncbi:MAG TPA: carboxymuconolactone decarboxylase family protein [Steroidobacteraceae bacterium]|nr:carboxymuconolactone decarboxylase family protein [Steroidobacteraceae bacterium]
MSVRIPLDPKKFADVIGGMIGLNKIIESSGIEEQLLLLVEIRVSQINGCGYCLDMHTKDARLAGETEQRIYLLSAWREAPLYSARERAALAWAEAVTRLENGEVPDAVYQQVREHFDEQQLMKLTLQIVAINGWNRFCISFNATPGTYVPGSWRKTGVAEASTSH